MIPTNCPQCNSSQSFGRQRDRWEDNEGVKYVREFIKCSMCHWTVVLFEGTENELRIRRDIDKLKGAVIRGVPAQRRLTDRQKSLVQELVANG